MPTIDLATDTLDPAALRDALRRGPVRVMDGAGEAFVVVDPVTFRRFEEAERARRMAAGSRLLASVAALQAEVAANGMTAADIAAIEKDALDAD
jgi:hypothetical protein